MISILGIRHASTIPFAHLFYVASLTLSVAVITALDNHPKLNFSLRRDHQKISYECRAYESVDDKSLS